MEQYLSSDSKWSDMLGLGGGTALGVIGTRTVDNFAADRLHPLVLFGAKALLGLGLGYAASGAGYPRIGAGITFGAMADATITYGNQIQYRYLPGAPSAALPGTTGSA